MKKFFFLSLSLLCTGILFTLLAVPSALSAGVASLAFFVTPIGMDGHGENRDRKTQRTLGHPSSVSFLKVMLGDIVADMRGKSQGMVYQRGRYGLIKRTKVTPVNPQSSPQQTQRGTFSANSSAWRDLTEAQRQTWIDGAPDFPYSDIFGNKQVLSGNSLYVKLNTVLVNLGQSALTDCPVPVAVDVAVIGTPAADASAHTLSVPFTETPIPAGFKLVIEATPQVSPGVNFMKNKYRVLARVDAGGTSPQAMGTAYEAMFGTLTEGKKIGVRIYLASKDSGQVGIATANTCIVVA